MKGVFTMETSLYSFEATQQDMLIDGQPLMGQSVLLNPAEPENMSPAYARLHLAELHQGEQVVVFYEHGNDTGNITLERTFETDGMHGWTATDVRMTREGIEQANWQDTTLMTADQDGFMNRHMFLRPGNELLLVHKQSAHTKSIGRIASIHFVEKPHTPQTDARVFPISPADAAFAKAA